MPKSAAAGAAGAAAAAARPKREALAAGRSFMFENRVKKKHMFNLKDGLPQEPFSSRAHCSAVQLQDLLEFVHNEDVEIRHDDRCVQCGNDAAREDTRLFAITCEEAPAEVLNGKFFFGLHRHGFLICAACWVGEHCAFTVPQKIKTRTDKNSRFNRRREGQREVFVCDAELMSSIPSCHLFCRDLHPSSDFDGAIV